MSKETELQEIARELARAQERHDQIAAALLPRREALICELALEGKGAAEIGRLAGISRGRVWQVLRRNGKTSEE